ncbi:MAG: hypothetical protein KJ006_04865 [Thermoleophilia bacterium]|nr:hypothetical protein [Thermoleophilia bacterium]GIK76441.1 MAG: hypothetical protein BroJett022_01310 [Actinomycetes bacterium]
MGRRLTALTAIGTITAIGAAAALAAAPPRIAELHYLVRDDGILPHTLLQAEVRRADSVRFATVFHGKHAAAPAREDGDDDWELRHGDGRKVYRLIRRSLDSRGSASVRVRARSGKRTDRVKLRIRESECSMDPPFYPLDCSIDR